LKAGIEIHHDHQLDGINPLEIDQRQEDSREEGQRKYASTCNVSS
jgi:hypothetical protein